MVRTPKADKVKAIYRAHDAIESALIYLVLEGTAYSSDRGFYPVSVLPSQLPPDLRQLYAILEVANANCVRFLKDN